MVDLRAMTPAPIAQVSIPVPLRRVYDFLVPEQFRDRLALGMRVQVPFGRRRRVIGIVVAFANSSSVPRARLRPIDAVPDTRSVFDPVMLRLLGWAADYYHHPIGEVMQTALPAALRNGQDLVPALPTAFCLTASGRAVAEDQLQRAPVQKRLLALLRGSTAGAEPQQLAAAGGSWRRALTLFMQRGWVEEITVNAPVAARIEANEGPGLSAPQRHAADRINAALGSYQAFCLFGVTGSGKTEVYIQVITEVLRRGRQVLVLVPEIGLTPQLINRLQGRFSAPLAILHSQLSDQARHRAWWQASTGEAKIILGTRSAVFVPMHAPGLIVLDEEHDPSFKQQDGFRYHARDLAIYRANLSGIPIVMGSATPSLETLANVERGRFQMLSLPGRAGGAALPQVRLVDLNHTPVEQGLALPVLEGIQARLQRGEQTLVFINRRGYALVLHCLDCDWQAICERCDARMIFHHASQQLRCHHCGATREVPDQCGACGSPRLKPLGAGTQRVETTITARFPHARVMRIDRDTTRGRAMLAHQLDQINAGGADILIGTQLLAKGHHFPNVTLVVVLNTDQGLYGVDFRSEEVLVQQLMQVAGRAGRARQPGEVLIQTRHPQHPVFSFVLRNDFAGFAQSALAQRVDAGFPPGAHFALLRAEAVRRGEALQFLRQARDKLLTLIAAQDRSRPHAPPEVIVGDPVPAPMEKRAGRYRAQLLLRARERPALHRHLDAWLRALEELPISRRARWTLDVDPTEML